MDEGLIHGADARRAMEALEWAVSRAEGREGAKIAPAAKADFTAAAEKYLEDVRARLDLTRRTFLSGTRRCEPERDQRQQRNKRTARIRRQRSGLIR